MVGMRLERYSLLVERMGSVQCLAAGTQRLQADLIVALPLLVVHNQELDLREHLQG
jgi:hypothetical protein